MKVIILVLLSVFVFVSSTAFALSISDVVTGVNITINDGRPDHGIGIGDEDNETESGTVHSQIWDAEAFFYDKPLGMLYLVSGFDYNSIVGGEHAGDIWLDTTRDNVMNYDIAISFFDDSASSQDDAGYWMFSGDNLQGSIPKYAINLLSQPVDYVSGDIDGGESINISYFGGLTGGLGISGWNGNDLHYVLAIQIGQLDYFNAHWTMSCGNDNIAAYSAHLPEPMSLTLFSIGLAGLGVFSRKRS